MMLLLKNYDFFFKIWFLRIWFLRICDVCCYWLLKIAISEYFIRKNFISEPKNYFKN